MKFIHLADLHLGKRVNEFSMLEDQQYILNEILKITEELQPDGVIIAGDVYDKPNPPVEAVQLLDKFIVNLSKMNLPVFMISGNHDSAEKLAFGNKLFEKSGIHISPVYDGKIKPFTMKDEYGNLNIYMLPFIKPANVRRYFEDEITSYTDAMRVAIEKMNVDTSERNIIVTHQFVTGASRSDSEEVSVGGSDNVDASVFEPFDYVALGHIHSPQHCFKETIRYCGTPLKYSFSEAKDHKSITVVDFKEKGNIEISKIPLVPLHDMHEIKGLYHDIMQKSFYEDTNYQTDYMHITLTDEEEIPDALAKLRTVYHNIMKMDYDNTRTRSSAVVEAIKEIETKSPLQLFSDFYETQNNQPMSEEQNEFILNLIEKIWGDNK